jgi:hypothetical protein
MLIMRLHIHNLHKQHISRFRSLYFKWPREVVDPREVDVLHIIGTIIISWLTVKLSGNLNIHHRLTDLSTSPIDL